MQTDLRKPNVEKISELIEKKATLFHLHEVMRHFWDIFYVDTFWDFNLRNNYIFEPNYSDPKFITNLLPEGSNRFFITDDIHLNKLRKRSNLTFKYTQLNEKIMSDHVGFYFPWNHFLHEAFDRKLGHMIDSGVVKKLVEDAAFIREAKCESFNPDVLTMEHLDVVFQIWLAGLCTALLQFIFEYLVYKICYKSFIAKKLLEMKNSIMFSVKYY